MLSELASSYTLDSDLAERAFALFPRGDWLYMLLSYADESTQDHEAIPTSAVSALTATGKNWVGFSSAWFRTLEEFDVLDKKGRRLFHTNEFETPEGRRGSVYENWDVDKRNRFNRALCDAIAHNGIQVSAASVIVADYEEVASKIEDFSMPNGRSASFSRSQAFGDRYVFCAFQAMTLAAEEAKAFYPKSTEIAYHFESGGGYQHQIEFVYDIAKRYEGNYFQFFEKPNFVDKGFAVALQAADKMAYEAAKHVSHMQNPAPPEKHSEIKDGKRVWKTRFPLEHLVLNGVDVHIRWWRKDDIEAFFTEGQSNNAKKAAARKTATEHHK